MEHHIWRKIRATALAALLAASPVPALAREEAAPLPDGLVASSQAKVRGLYAEDRFGRVDVNEAVTQLESSCATRGLKAKIEGSELQWSGKRQIYRDRDRVAVFENIPTISADSAACTARISLRRTSSVLPATKGSLQFAGWDHDIPVCKPRSLIHSCMEQVIAGVKARCVSVGDPFVGSTNCYSAQPDLSEGLMLSRSDYSDDGSLPDNSWQIATVLPDALIDPAVFGARPYSPTPP
ncbi:hypothetical protein HZY97_20540 [Sphingomonas sp. R-74633]|uniref:hypothetical protein n=1 Tax=Sphingomonas sp. R-74633 TaxID=2751188 RepID=UPI0015D3F321|nr:hypothetical protein [Sphingomonas sp. R-74633]NYT43175.1 hypothetical protein [Sphingomonas sp. R-74633]